MLKNEVIVSFSLPLDLKDKIDQTAAKRKVSKSKLLRQLLEAEEFWYEKAQEQEITVDATLDLMLQELNELQKIRLDNKPQEKVKSTHRPTLFSHGGTQVKNLFKSVLKMAFGAVVMAAALIAGPPTYNKVAKLFEEPPLSPLAKVVLEKLQTASWTIQDQGIACDTLWIRGESMGRNAKSLDSSEISNCGVYVRNASVSKEVALNDQLSANDMKVILPKAKEMYQRLLAERNAATAESIQAVKEEEEPKPQPAPKKVRQPNFSTAGKTIFDGLKDKNLWRLEGRNNTTLMSKANGAISIDTSGPSQQGDMVIVRNLEANKNETCVSLQLTLEERSLILERARETRDALVQDTIKGALTTISPTRKDDQAQRVAAELTQQK